jgi:hypothetical protein
MSYERKWIETNGQVVIFGQTVQAWVEQQNIPRRRSVKQYADALRSGLWGGALEIMVFTQLYPVTVEVYILEDGENYMQMQVTKGSPRAVEKTARLLYMPNHYDWLTPHENRIREEARLLQDISHAELENSQAPSQQSRIEESQTPQETDPQNNNQQPPTASSPNQPPDDLVEQDENTQKASTCPQQILGSATEAFHISFSRSSNKFRHRPRCSQRTAPERRIAPKVGQKRGRSYFTGRISRYPLLTEEPVAKRTRTREQFTSTDPVWELRDSPNLTAYEFLNIPVTATTAEVRQAYRRLMAKCHPDKNLTSQEVAKHFSQKVDLLTSEELRPQYDEFLKAQMVYGFVYW